MWLLHCTTLEFKNFQGDNLPLYAILSHTWGDEEVSFQEILNGQGKRKAGYDKIKRCGQLAAQNSPVIEYFWVDTCCIDKSSSAELSEAISSMYHWYKNASVCYTYLSDVSATSPPHATYDTVSTFQSSRWFSRGWTLQELIAPSNLIFFSKEWKPIGTKETLKGHIQEITGISTEALDGAELGLFSVAERMSWASKRKTTRIEDMAYSLIGIFDVNMPLVYGEREKSFIRLQEEIMKSSDDQSIFAWADESVRPEKYLGLLARSPEDFARSGNISSLGIWGKSNAFSMTNKGLRVGLFLTLHNARSNIYKACLDCYYKACIEKSPAIFLQSVPVTECFMAITSATQFARVYADRIITLENSHKTDGKYITLHVRQNPNMLLYGLRELGDSRLFRIINARGGPLAVHPHSNWNPQADIFSSPLKIGKVGSFSFDDDGMFYVIILGFSEQGTPWINITPSLSRDPYKDWTSYESTGRELSSSIEVCIVEKFQRRIFASVIRVEVHGAITFLVQVATSKTPLTIQI